MGKREARPASAAPWGAIAAAALVAAGLWPYAIGLGLPPATSDAATWIARTATFRTDWLEWTFCSRHFVGYRPLTALSFAVNQAITGLAPEGFRAVQLALHATAALLLLRLYRRLAPDLPSWGGWVAAAVFLVHPGVEDVVPFLARRSYLLAACAGLASLSAFAGAVRDDRISARGAATATVLLIVALLCNESAFVVAFAAPLVVLHAQGRRAAPGLRLLAVALPLAATAAVLALRFAVIGGLGGYPLDPRLERRALAFLSFWPALLGLDQLPGDVLPAALAIGALAYYAWWLVARRGAPRGLGALLLLWLVGHPLLYAIAGTWFPRQVYPALPPFALLVGIALATTSRRASGPEGRGRAVTLGLHLAPQLLVLGFLLSASPVLRGPDPDRLAIWRRHAELLADLESALRNVREPAHVLLVLPYSSGQADEQSLPVRPAGAGPARRVTRAPVTWLETRLHGRAVTVEPLLFYAEGVGAGPELVRRDGVLNLVLPTGLPVQYGVAGRPHPAQPGERIRLEAGSRPQERSRYVYVGGSERGELVALGRGEG